MIQTSKFAIYCVCFAVLFAGIFISSINGKKGAGECAMMNFFTIREAKKTLPKPKVGDFCSTAMEQGFSDACVALCMEERPIPRVAQTCRAAAVEMPRPTVRRWCEHGYNVAFEKTVKDLRYHFKQDSIEEESVANVEENRVLEEKVDHSPQKTEPEIKEAPVESQKVVAVIPVTLDDSETIDLTVYEGQNPEEAVAQFCRKHSAAANISSCMRELLDVVLDEIKKKEA